MQIPLRAVVTPILLGLLFCAAVAEAAVVVVGNRTRTEVAFSVTPPDGQAEDVSLAGGDVVPIPVAGNVLIAFEVGDTVARFSLEPNTICYFAHEDGELGLLRIVLEPDPASGAETSPDHPDSAGRKPAAASSNGKTSRKADPSGVMPVKILVDDNEPGVRRVWEQRLRARMAEVSQIIFRYCRIRFEVVAVGTWESDDTLTDFGESLREFEREATPSPGAIAIGFTSQHKLTGKRHRVGGTRGPLHSHVLVRESSPQFTEAERVETLVHELGHVLGAVHSADPTSVMRSVLGDRLARARDFRIHFDEINTLAVYLVCEETPPQQGAELS